LSNNPKNIIKYVRQFFFYLLESTNPSQIRVLEPFVIVFAMKLWEVTHAVCSAPSPLLTGS